jgi:hypothetical protein
MTEFQFGTNGLVLNANIDGTRIFGRGIHAPTLLVPVTFQYVRGASVFDYGLGSLAAELELNVPREPIAISSPCLLGMTARSATQVQLVVPISLSCVHWIEQLREAGAGVSFFVNLRLEIKTLRPDGREGTSPLHRYVSDEIQTKQGVVEIPRETWTKFLEAIGYGKICVVEFPAAPLEHCASLKNAYAALQQALRLHREGFHTQAVGQCRVALDKFWAGRNPKQLIPAWSDRLGNVAYHWLNETLRIIRREANEPHHTAEQPGAPVFDYFDAQMFIALTTAVVAYAARAGVTEKP